ncbi:MAG: NAD(P)/FAD-dependent oxidoreductase [Actinomycetota bacterium]|jgi:NADH dehydrogenase|nr:NAD(P)/FAD-dependent oxidoreductase [Actinomycetota bacterium]
MSAIASRLAKVVLLIGLAASVYTRRRRPPPLRVAYSEAATKILVVGGGFGGLAAAEGLARAFSGSREVGVGLLDRHNYTTFWPVVPSALSGNIEVRHAAYPLRRVLRPLGVTFLQAEVEEVDFENRNVGTEEGDCPYDYLILALGSRTAFFGSGASEHAFDLKGLTNVVRIRDQVLDCFEEAERLRGEHGDDLLTFVFIGGGTTGVEGIADTHDLIFGVLEEDYPNVDFDRVRLVLVNADETILKGVDPALAHAASLRLASQRVEIINKARAEEVRPDAVILSGGRTIPTLTTVWTAGTEPALPVGDLSTHKDHRGRIVVDEFLRVKDRPGVYAVGDCVSVDQDGSPVPALAQAAEQEGNRAARNLAAEIEGREPEPFRYRSLGQLVDLGEGSALVDILGVKFGGLLGALVWRGVYLYELGHNLNRVQVLFDWTTDLFFRPNTSKLFEDPARR